MQRARGIQPPSAHDFRRERRLEIDRTDPENPRSNDADVYHLRDAEFWAGDWTDPLRAVQKAADVAEAARKRRAAEKRAAGILPKGGRKKKDTRPDLPENEGGVMGDATPDPVENPGGGVMGDARGGVMGDARGGVMGDALGLDPVFESRSQDLSLSPFAGKVTNGAGTVPEAAEAAEEREINSANTNEHPDVAAVVAVYAEALGRPLLH